MSLPIVKSEVLVVGAGVLGVSVAYHLAARGVSVVVLEREGGAAAHASGKSAGMIRQLYRHPQLTEWATRSVAGWPSDLRGDYYHQTGSLIVGRSTPDHHRHLFTEANVRGTPAVYTASDGLLDSGGFTRALWKRAEEKGAAFRFRSAVIGAQRLGGRWCAETADGHLYVADWIVNAGGAWLNSFLSDHAVDAQAYARHLIETDGVPLSKPTGFYWDEQLEWYCREWSGSWHLLSICDEHAADPDCFTPTAQLPELVTARLQRAFPRKHFSLSFHRSWHCFRTYASDRLPLWGEDPTSPHLFWLGAFGGYGMSTAFAAAEDAALYILHGKNQVGSCFLPRRTPRVRSANE